MWKRCRDTSPYELRHLIARQLKRRQLTGATVNRSEIGGLSRWILNRILFDVATLHRTSIKQYKKKPCSLLFLSLSYRHSQSERDWAEYGVWNQRWSSQLYVRCLPSSCAGIRSAIDDVMKAFELLDDSRSHQPSISWTSWPHSSNTLTFVAADDEDVQRSSHIPRRNLESACCMVRRWSQHQQRRGVVMATANLHNNSD